MCSILVGKLIATSATSHTPVRWISSWKKLLKASNVFSLKKSIDAVEITWTEKSPSKRLFLIMLRRLVLEGVKADKIFPQSFLCLRQLESMWEDLMLEYQNSFENFIRELLLVTISKCFLFFQNSHENANV